MGHDTPAAYADPETFTFEKHVPSGFADAYFEGHFGWEFKGQDAQLDGAFDQLLRYQVHLKTPPLLIVSSFETLRIQTNFPGLETARYDIGIAEFDRPDRLALVKDVFFAPHRFQRHLRSVEAVTRDTAKLFQAIVVDMEKHNEDPERLARYLNQLVFCLYAEDAGLLPDELFSRVVHQHYRTPETFDGAVRSLFAQMRTGGFSGAEEIAHFNGDLFNVVETVELSRIALQRLGEACKRNWRDIEPSIFGTLFERALDASKRRAKTGAHYTGADDIKLVVEPVVMKPLRKEWESVRQEVTALLNNGKSEGARNRLEEFRKRLASVTVLDPACGSGNFLYISLQLLLDLEREVIDFAALQGWYGLVPIVQPDQMLGLEKEYYAAELARTALWIGYIQWHQANGFPYIRRPVLTPLHSIRQADAILDQTNPNDPVEPEWPSAEFIVSNPPFLGHVPFRNSLGDHYVEAVYQLYGNRIPNSSDLCCYWLEKARAQIEGGKTLRAGLLATQAIRFQSNRRVLERIKETGDIFEAISDKDWVLEGAAVHISIICFDDGSDTDRALDGNSVPAINSDLTIGFDLTAAKPLTVNEDIAFQGVGKVGDFDISALTAAEMLDKPNPHGRPNEEVIRRWVNGVDITRRPRDMWIIDFGIDLSEDEASLYEAPFEHIKAWVKPERIENSVEWRAKNWWLHGYLASEMRTELSRLPRYIGTSVTAKHRFFVWLPADSLPSNSVVAIATAEDYVMGVLHSKQHVTWSLAMGTQLEDRPRYIVSTCFETFPFPHPTEDQRQRISAAAMELNSLREGWLNPDKATAAELRRRTLTNLYNQRPTWLDNIHARIDEAVAEAYGWPANLTEAEILERLLALNLERAGSEGAP